MKRTSDSGSDVGVKHDGHNVDLSVVAPLYNEVEGVTLFCDRLCAVLDEIGSSYEIILVDDGSKDGSFERVRQFAEKNRRVRGIKLSRNFGHQVALTAGLDHARGDVVITMDSDLQHPPEVIPKLLEQCALGYDIVYTVRIDTADTGFWKRQSSALFYKLINRLSDVRIEPAAADFRLMTKRAVQAYRQFSERGRFTRGLVTWMGFEQSAVTYQAAPRAAGQSKYTLRKMLLLAADGITAFSSRPLRVSFRIGLILLVFSLAYSVYAVWAYLTQPTVPGWTSILLSVLIIGAVQLLSLGIIGEYIARIYTEVKQRPLYFVGGDTDDARVIDDPGSPDA